MKRYVLFGFPDYETAWLERCIVGVCNDLDKAIEQVEYDRILQALDTKTGDIWTYTADKSYLPKEWKESGSVKTYPVLDVPERECAVDGCENTFQPRFGGYPGKYCSEACKAKAYRRRKKETLTA
jgi:hypothetical protein